MSKYINPFLDWSFKHLFGQESNKDLLIDLINAVLQGDVVVQDVEFLNKERQPEVVDGKAIIYDLLCRTDQGEYIIVEMQNNEKSNFKDRSLFYMSRAVVDQARKGNEWRYNLKAVYGIFFVNFKLEDTGNDDPTESRTEVVLMNRVTHKVFNRKFIQIFVEIPLFNKQESDCQTDYDRWIYVLKNLETMECIPFARQKAIFAHLDESAARANLSHEDRVRYDAELKTFRDYFSELETAMAKGEARGEARGVAIGEANTKREMALKMRQAQLAIEQIMAFTGLSADEIESL